MNTEIDLVETYKSYEINGIIDENDTHYLVEWKCDNSQSWILKKDANITSVEIFETKKKCNILNANNCINILSAAKRAYIYCRISSNNNGNISLNAQENMLLNHCKDNNYYINNIIFEVKSAKNMNHLHGLNQIFNEIINNEDKHNIVLCVYDISRFSRNMSQALEKLDLLLEMNIEIDFIFNNLKYSSSSTAQMKHQLRTELSQSQYLSEYTSDKVKNSIKYKKSLGEFIGKAPTGFTIKDKILTPIDLHSTVLVNKVEHMLLNGKSYKDILNDRKSAGLKYSSGTLISESFIDYINNKLKLQKRFK